MFVWAKVTRGRVSSGSLLWLCISLHDATRECHACTSFHTVARISCRCKTSTSCKKGRTPRFCMKSASWRTGTSSACANFHTCAYMSISFPEPTCLLVSPKTPCLGADQKTRGLWERDCLHVYLTNFVSLQISQIYGHEGNRRALTFTVWSKRLYMVLTRSINI